MSKTLGRLVYFENFFYFSQAYINIGLHSEFGDLCQLIEGDLDTFKKSLKIFDKNLKNLK